MAIDLCIESAGWVAHFVEVNVAHSFLPLRHGARIRQSTEEQLPTKQPIGSVYEPLDPAARVRTAAADLPIEQAGAVWLIDVCGCSYETAAAALSVSRDDLAATVTEARQTIRNSLATPVR